MRLLKRGDKGDLSLTDDLPDQDVPKYVILSHTWGATGQEVTLQDFQSLSPEKRMDKAGYAKIRFCSDQAAQDGYQYFWIDTCCIDKTNNVELTEAINSMFRWYREAARCYVYLSDVNVVELQHEAWQDNFACSRWFTRGWTLQELLAPRRVEFFSSEGIRLGDKVSLEREIHRTTGIAIEALRGRSLFDFSVSERMGWATKRTKTRKEDEAYSLLGIFDIHMPLIYGEREKALVRLREQIERSLRDPAEASYLSIDTSNTSMPALHPVKKNYRKVHVTILHWEADQLRDMVQRISDVFRSLYHYEVQEIPLPHRQRVKLAWPWVDESLVDEKDLQIMYYLGSTVTRNVQNVNFLDIIASPARRVPTQELYPDDPRPFQSTDIHDPHNGERYPKPSWLSNMITMPQLNSDVFIVLDYFVEELLGADTTKVYSMPLNEEKPWPRYLALFADYTKPPTMSDRLSHKLTSLLERLATSGRFYAREGLITAEILLEKLERAVQFNDGLSYLRSGNRDWESIRLSPLQRSDTHGARSVSPATSHGSGSATPQKKGPPPPPPSRALKKPPPPPPPPKRSLLK